MSVLSNIHGNESRKREKEVKTETEEEHNWKKGTKEKRIHSWANSKKGEQ